MGGYGNSQAVFLCRAKSFKIISTKASVMQFVIESQCLTYFVVSGDRVQWFRAEAEMHRWQEEWEMGQADYMRCIRFFRAKGDIWTSLVADGADDDLVRLGKNASARKEARMYADMADYAVKLLSDQGYSYLLDDKKPLYQHLDEVRALPENVLSYQLKTTA